MNISTNIEVNITKQEIEDLVCGNTLTDVQFEQVENALQVSANWGDINVRQFNDDDEYAESVIYEILIDEGIFTAGQIEDFKHQQ